MAQRLALAAAAGVAAFVIVLLGALGAYVAVQGTPTQAALAGQRTQVASVDAPLQAQSDAPGSTQGTEPGNTTGPSGYPISADQAVGVALSSAPGASLAQQPRLVNFQGYAAYEVRLDKGYVYIDATSGHLLYNG